MSTVVERVAARVKDKLSGESSGHDWHHCYRVWQLARRLAMEEGANVEVVELAAITHDIADWKFHDGDESVGPREARRLLEEEGVAQDVIDQVTRIIATISFKGAGVQTTPETLEGRCVQDADRLDAMGAVGIARCFAYGGHAGRELYNPDIVPTFHQSADAYKANKSPSLNHFYEKLLLLKDRMNTSSGQRIAAERHEVMLGFIQQFLKEWTGQA